MTSTETSWVPPAGLKGVPVVGTELGAVRGSEGFFHYRQYDGCQLARDHDVETIWRVLVDGGAPGDTAAQAAFGAELAALRAVPRALQELAAALPRDVAPLDGARALLAALRTADAVPPLLDQTPTERRRTALRVGATWPLLVGMAWRRAQGLPPLMGAPPAELGHAAVVLWALSGEVPAPARAEALDTYLGLTVDHGLNASTFATRVVASTGADLVGCVLAGLSALSGPLHGGAPARVLEMLDAIGPAANAAAFAATELAAGRRLMGFGHAVYRTTDPRSDLLREVAAALVAERAAQAQAIETTLLAALRAAKPDRVLATNVEYYAAVVLEGCGLPPALCTPMFACARIIGWGAHAVEQAHDGVLFRPKARYVGPPPAALSQA
ncbi:MAG: citrate/2-methylcitrate synthase [Planctomycetota bacterium]